MLLQLDHLGVAFGEKVLFDNAHLVINKGDRIGIVAPNGSGKTTLFKVLLDVVSFEGQRRSTVHSIGYLSQDESLSSNRKEEIESLLADESVLADEQRYASLLEEYEHYVQNQERMQVILEQLSFDKEAMNREGLSGGEHTKLKLAQVLSEDHDVLLLDEPTNHLDVPAKEALIRLLEEFPTVVFISHDVDLLNQFATSILEIRNKKLYFYSGNYDYYIEEKEKEFADAQKQIALNNKQRVKAKEKITQQVQWSAHQMKRKTSHLASGQVLSDMGSGHGGMEQGIAKTRQNINKLQAKIDNLDDVELDVVDDIKISYPSFTKPNTESVMATNITKSYGSFTLSIQDFILGADDKLAIQGNNGSGKSTFIKIVTGTVNPDEGSVFVGSKVVFGYVGQKNDTLHLENSVLDELKAVADGWDEGNLRTYLGKFLFKKNAVFRTIADLSGGEKMRLAILKTIISGANVLVLDEPSNHLDIKSKTILAQALADFPGAILVISHDDYFLDQFVTKKIKMVNGSLVY
jgi:ATP-binding cassette subfamily F protein 3